MRVRLNKTHNYEWNFAYSSDCSEWKWKIQSLVDCTYNKFINWLPLLKDKIVLDPADSWSADYSLAKIIVPLVQQLKSNQHGYGQVSDEDVPEELRTDNSDYSEAKYNWMIDEIIWSMDQIARNEPDSPELPDDICSVFDDSYIEERNTPEYKKLIKEWSAEVTRYESRLDNGCKLFGLYFRSLWD